MKNFQNLGKKITHSYLKEKAAFVQEYRIAEI